MTNQEIFDKVHQHLLTQRVAAVADGACAYRAGTRSCAVGALIPDNIYVPAIEGCSVSVLVSDSKAEYNSPLAPVLTAAGFTPDQYTLLRDLQRVHDRLLPRTSDKPRPDPMARALCGLRLVAAQHGLTCEPYKLAELVSVLDYLEYATCPPQIK